MTDIFEYNLPRLLGKDDDDFEKASKSQDDDDIESFIQAVSESGLFSLMQEEIENRTKEEIAPIPIEENFNYQKDIIFLDILRQCLTLLTNEKQQEANSIYKFTQHILFNDFTSDQDKNLKIEGGQ